MSNELIKKTGHDLLSYMVNILSGNPVGALVDIFQIGKDIYDIPNYRVWSNFIIFLKAGGFGSNKEELNYDSLRKLATILAEQGNRTEHAKRIVYIISDVETEKESVYIGNLTNALINEKLDFSQYFRCMKIISHIIPEDLELLGNKLERKDFVFDLAHESTLEYVNNGLIIQKDGKLVPTNLAYDLINCGVRWGHSEIPKPKELPEYEIINTHQIAYIESCDENSITMSFNVDE